VKIKNTVYVLMLLLVFALAACGGGSGSDSAEPQQLNDSTAPDVLPDNIDVEDIVHSPVKDMGGRDFRWLSWWDLQGTMPGDPPPNPDESDNYMIHMMMWENEMRVYNDYNVTITNVTVGFDEVMEVLTTSVMAGDPAADLVNLGGGWILNAIIGNLLIPYEDFLPPDHDIFTTRDHGNATSFLLDRTWTVERRNRPNGGCFVGVNLDIIRSIGAENPAELYDRGEWTMDKYVDIARLATRDTTGDGNIDQYGIGGQPVDILNAMIAANDGMLVTPDLKYGYDHPHSMRAIEYAYQIFNVDKSWNYDPLSGAEFWDWNRNTYAFLEGRTAMFHAWIWSLPDLEDRTFDYTAVPYPKGPDNMGDYSYFSSFEQGVAIPRGINDPEDVFTIWYEMGKWYGNDFDLKDEEDLSWPYSKFNTARDGERIMDALSKGRKFDIGGAIHVDGVGYDWISGGFAQSAFEDTATPAQFAEENRQERQNMLDTVFGSLALNY
jgi:multiple sugar transport system substrate-binding protein